VTITEPVEGVGQIRSDPSPAELPADDVLRPWVARTARLIADRLADARVHSEAGRTFEANSRLNELRRDLLDAPAADGGSLLSNARAAFYRQAFHAEPFDPAIHRELRPDPAGELAARFSLIGGRNQYIDGRLKIEEAIGSLRGLGDVATIMRDSKPPEHWRRQYDSWQARHTEGLTAHIRGTLSDAQMSLYSAVGQLRIKPELL
jgi:hypothetical protein